MTAVCQKVRTGQNQNSWTSVFPNTKTESESRTFVKRLTGISISTILYLRKILSADNFEAKVFEGMTLRILKPRPEYEGAELIGKWLCGAFDAIDKKYLKQLQLEVKDSESDYTLELYTMSFDYDDGKESLSVSFKSDKTSTKFFAEESKIAMSDIQIKTIRLLQMCHNVTKTCSSLPPQVMLAMRLSYHEGTPEDYQPTGYKPCEAFIPVYPKATRSIELGTVDTNHHHFKLISKTCLNEISFSEMDETADERTNEENDVNQTDEETLMSEEETGNFFLDSVTETKPNGNAERMEEDSGSDTEISLSQYQELLSKDKSSVVKDGNQLFGNMPEEMSQNIVSDESGLLFLPKNYGGLKKQKENLKPKTEIKLRCPCKSEIKSSIVIMCSGCRYWFHAECYGIQKTEHLQNNQFYCIHCDKMNENAVCCDIVMVNMKSSDQQKLALLRRILSYCNRPGSKTVTHKKMEQIVGLNNEEKLLDIITKKLVEIGVAVPQEGKNTYLINKEIVAEEIPQYFSSIQLANDNASKFSPMKTSDRTTSRTSKHKDNSKDAITDEPSNKKSRSSITTPEKFETKRFLRGGKLF